MNAEHPHHQERIPQVSATPKWFDLSNLHDVPRREPRFSNTCHVRASHRQPNSISNLKCSELDGATRPCSHCSDLQRALSILQITLALMTSRKLPAMSGFG
jgi:hypothetical protein